MTTFTAPATFRNSSAHALRFDRLHPGSYFRIVSEPSRGLRRTRDTAIYQKARDGFYAENISSKTGLVLMPEDMCMPLTKSRANV